MDSRCDVSGRVVPSVEPFLLLPFEGVDLRLLLGNCARLLNDQRERDLRYLGLLRLVQGAGALLLGGLVLAGIYIHDVGGLRVGVLVAISGAFLLWLMTLSVKLALEARHYVHRCEELLRAVTDYQSQRVLVSDSTWFAAEIPHFGMRKTEFDAVVDVLARGLRQTGSGRPDLDAVIDLLSRELRRRAVGE
jgi:hypothetical protein